MAGRDIYRWKLEKPWQRVMFYFTQSLASKSMSLPIITHAQPIRLSPCNICEKGSADCYSSATFHISSAGQRLKTLQPPDYRDHFSGMCNLCVWPTGATSAAKAEFYCCLLILHLQLSIDICVMAWGGVGLSMCLLFCLVSLLLFHLIPKQAYVCISEFASQLLVG